MNHPDWNDKTILIAEEEKINYLFLRALFAPTGVEVLWAKNGDQAIELCRHNGGVDLVLMDMMVPDKNGKEATRQIKKLQPEVAVIGQTSLSYKNDREEAYQAGCDALLNKPVEPQNLLAVLEKHLASD